MDKHCQPSEEQSNSNPCCNNPDDSPPFPDPPTYEELQAAQQQPSSCPPSLNCRPACGPCEQGCSSSFNCEPPQINKEPILQTHNNPSKHLKDPIPQPPIQSQPEPKPQAPHETNPRTEGPLPPPPRCEEAPGGCDLPHARLRGARPRTKRPGRISEGRSGPHRVCLEIYPDSGIVTIVSMRQLLHEVLHGYGLDTIKTDIEQLKRDVAAGRRLGEIRCMCWPQMCPHIVFH